jgi:hypothetical protein
MWIRKWLVTVQCNFKASTKKLNFHCTQKKSDGNKKNVPPKDTQSVGVKWNKLNKRLAKGFRQASGEFTDSNGSLNNRRPSCNCSLADQH